MKKPTLKVRPYRNSKNHKFILDLRGYGKGRMFFKTRAEADAECLRQKTLLERHSREAVGLSQREMSEFITAKNKLAEYGKTICAAVFLNQEDAIDYATSRACFRSGEIRILDSHGAVVRIIPFSKTDRRL
jgi:hypothetical protein